MTTTVQAPKGGQRLFANITALIAEQEEWIRDHGGDEAGYVKRYGSAVAPEHYGNGGEAIFRADGAHLERLKTDLSRVRGRR